MVSTMVVISSLLFFFFKQKTAYEMRISDWSSDVCSSDLPVTGRIVVAGDVETAQRRREQDGGEMRGRERRRRRQMGQHHPQRQDGLDAFAGRHYIVRLTEPDGMSAKITHRTSRRVDPRLAAAVGGEPGAVRPGAPGAMIGTRRDHRPPGPRRGMVSRAIVAARLEPQFAGSVQSRRAT